MMVLRIVSYLILFTVSLDTYATCSKLKVGHIIETSHTASTVRQRRALRHNLFSGTQVLRADLEVQSSVLNSTAESEAQILLEFRKGIIQDLNDVLLSWSTANTSDYCNWSGVSCQSPTGQVSALNLSGLQLTGSISASLGGLQYLSSLDLSLNRLEGIIPPSISNCSSLTVLMLGNNFLTGGIPPSLGKCDALLRLDVKANFLSGPIPKELGNLESLSYLDLSSNTLGGFIPLELGNLTNLSVLYLGNNTLEGPIPIEFGNLQSLTQLYLGFNNLGGFIPTELGNIKNLSYLHLGFNTLDGPIPVSLLDRSSLSSLYLFGNHLNGSIHKQVGMLSDLKHLYLWGNQLTGPIPDTLTNCTSLTIIDLRDNQLSGQIPLAIGTLSELQIFYLQNNYLVGTIPASLANCSQLQELLLFANQFTGDIPSHLGLLQNLTEVHLGSNFLVGAIPSALGYSKGLRSLTLAQNQLNGQIPSVFGNLSSLQGLNLSGNALTGGIPAELSQCGQLSVLDLSGNFLRGTIPNDLGLLSNLNQLYLNDNYLTGLMSSVLGLQWVNLLAFSVSNNRLNGGIDGSDFNALRRLQLKLDLSHNLLSGPIPPGIGSLSSVQSIDLSFNFFSGAIPDALGSCLALAGLDLSSNNLSGAIPPSLASLIHLVYLNVSFNELTGPVPDSGPFVNFSGGSYLGNPALCGPMLPQKCSSAPSGKTCRGGLCHGQWAVIVPVVAAAIAASLGVAAFWFLFIAKRTDQNAVVGPAIPPATHFTKDFQGLSVDDIVAATDGFSDTNIMGVGSRSTVYVGFLPGGVTIAVKRLALGDEDKATFELYRELQRLSTLEHPNLLKVHGLFSAGNVKALVMEHMANGSLRKQFYEGENCRITWAQRLDIALGVAEALVHLHHSRSKPILHLDLKPNNILVGEDMVPKVADYGISTFINHESHGDMSISSNVYGTIGYIPPEYGAMAGASTKGDVYNYGMVLMELFTRKQPTADMFGQEVSLRSWVVDAYPDRISHILDSALQQELTKSDQDLGIRLIMRLAVACTQNAPKDRPTMIQARDMVIEIKSLQRPHKAKPAN